MYRICLFIILYDIIYYILRLHGKSSYIITTRRDLFIFFFFPQSGGPEFLLYAQLCRTIPNRKSHKINNNRPVVLPISALIEFTSHVILFYTVLKIDRCLCNFRHFFFFFSFFARYYFKSIRVSFDIFFFFVNRLPVINYYYYYFSSIFLPDFFNFN